MFTGDFSVWPEVCSDDLGPIAQHMFVQMPVRGPLSLPSHPQCLGPASSHLSP